MSPADLTALAKTLYRQGRGEDSVLLLSMATRTGPVEAAVDFVDSLREMGRPVDANALLDEVGQSSAQDVARLLEGLEERGRTRDRDRLLSAIAAQPAPARLALLREPFLADGRYDEVFTSFGTASDEAFAEVLEQLRDTGSHLDLLALFGYGARRAPAGLAARLAWLERGGFPEALALRACLSDRGISAGGRVPTLDKGNLEAVADRLRSPTGLALALAALRALGREEAVRYAARRAAGAWFDSARRLELTLSLRRRGLHGTARVVIKGDRGTRSATCAPRSPGCTARGSPTTPRTRCAATPSGWAAGRRSSRSRSAWNRRPARRTSRSCGAPCSTTVTARRADRFGTAGFRARPGQDRCRNRPGQDGSSARVETPVMRWRAKVRFSSAVWS